MYKLFNLSTREYLQDSKTFEHIIFTESKAKDAKSIYSKLTGQKFKLIKAN